MPANVETVITRKQKINHDCYIFTFEFIDEKITFTIGQYFKIVKFLPTH
jgi:NAD(P)H-flavin reductase